MIDSADQYRMCMRWVHEGTHASLAAKNSSRHLSDIDCLRYQLGCHFQQVHSQCAHTQDYLMAPQQTAQDNGGSDRTKQQSCCHDVWLDVCRREVPPILFLERTCAGIIIILIIDYTLQHRC